MRKPALAIILLCLLMMSGSRLTFGDIYAHFGIDGLVFSLCAIILSGWGCAVVIKDAMEE